MHFNLYRGQVLLIEKISMNVLSFLAYAVTGGVRTPWEVLRVNVVKDTLWTNLEFVVLVRKLILTFKHNVSVHI